MSKRIYLDYNATSPLSDSVKEYLGKGDFLFANPSSIHSSGKKSKRAIEKVRNYLYELYDLDQNHWDTLFHSGATEAINTFLKGFGLKHFPKTCNVVISKTDHSAVFGQREDLEKLGLNVFEFQTNEHGDFEITKLKNLLEQCEGPTLLNYTWVNNETGVVWDLGLLEELKKANPYLYIHVDAVQSVGKIQNWTKLSEYSDVYTFSAHKFGGMKGVGFSFVKKDFPFEPLIKGGGQQNSLRSGTENTDGIYSILLSLQDLVEKGSFEELLNAKNKIESDIKNLIADSGFIMGAQAKNRSANTISLVMRNVRADILMTAFDLAGIDVSSGSACSSGSISPSRVLMAMGQNEQLAKSALRLSFGPCMNFAQVDEMSQKICSILSRFK